MPVVSDLVVTKRKITFYFVQENPFHQLFIIVLSTKYENNGKYMMLLYKLQSY